MSRVGDSPDNIVSLFRLGVYNRRRIGLLINAGTLSQDSETDPPTYTSASPLPAKEVVERPNPAPALPPGLKPSNYLLLSRTYDVSETFVVDPTLWVLPALLPPLPPREARKNLQVVSSSGRVNASIYLVDGADRGESRISTYTARTSSPSAARTTMYIQSAASAQVTLVCARTCSCISMRDHPSIHAI